MSKAKKAVDYICGAVLHPKLCVYYVRKFLKYNKFGYSDELMYWKHEIHGKSSDYSQDMQEEDIHLALESIRRDFGVSGRDVKCLEIGPGPRSRLTSGYDQGLFDLVAIDPLADDFVREFGGREFLMNGKGEDISKLFKPDSIHMVYASNSIDHSEDPPKIFQGINEVLKKNGILIVCGDVCSANISHWLGLHQHNFVLDNGELLWQDKEMSKTNAYKTMVSKNQYSLIKSYINKVDAAEPYLWFFGMWKKL